MQLVHWGSLRPDPIPLLIDGINVATGPNGSGKTCFLDGIKLLLGVTSFAPGRSSHRYIFDGGPGGTAAERAFLRATFSNPVLDGGERLFAVADERLRDADHVSVICLVTADSRRYLVLPGLHRWGFERPLAEDLEAFLAAHPEADWLGPRRYDELLDRTGITRALREVLALPQGAIDRTMDEQPAGLLAKLLELTGERALLDEVEAQRERAGDARHVPDRAQRQVLVEGAADRDQQSPQRDVVGHPWRPNGTKEDRVVAAEPIQAVGGHHLAGLQVVVAAPGQLVPLEAKAVEAPCLLEHALGRRDDLVTDAVARQNRDSVDERHGRARIRLP